VFRILPLVLVALLAACSKSSPSSDSPTTGTETTAPGTTAATPPAPAPAPPASAPDGAADPPPASAFVKPVPEQLPAVVARVNGEAVSKEDFQREVTNRERRAGSTIPANERDRVLRGILDELIAFRLLLQESRARKLPVSDADIDARLADIRKQFPSEEAFKGAMAAQNTTLDEVRKEMRQELLVTKLLETEVGPKSSVAPGEVEKIYKENPQAFVVREQVRASHILITVAPDADATAKAEALAKAKSVLKSARAGNDFAALAKEFSQDPGSAAQGGDLGLFSAEQMVPPFSKAAFSLRPGGISDLVETQFGYHIIKVAEKQPARTIPLDEVRPQVEEFLQNQNRQEQTDIFVKSLRSKGNVEILI